MKNRSLRSIPGQAILVAGLLLPAIFPAQANSQPLQLHFVTGNDYKPFTDEDLPEGGIASALVKSIFTSHGYDVRISFLPWKRAWEATLAGDYDGIFPYVPSSAREEVMHYSKPVFDVSQHLWSSGQSRLTLADVHSEQNLRLCAPQGYKISARLMPLKDEGHITLVQPRDPGTCPRMLLTGRADLFVSNDWLMPALLRDNGVPRESLFRAPESIHYTSLHFLTPRAAPRGRNIVMLFDREMAQMKRDGRFQALVSSHMGAGSIPDMTPPGPAQAPANPDQNSSLRTGTGSVQFSGCVPKTASAYTRTRQPACLLPTGSDRG